MSGGRAEGEADSPLNREPHTWDSIPGPWDHEPKADA